MDKLLKILITEKSIVDANIAKDWDMVKLYSFKASSTMKALRKLNNILLENSRFN